MSGKAEDKLADRDGLPVVMIVEDDVITRSATAEALRTLGFRVIEAADGQEAISVLETDMRVDVVFSDMKMRGPISGLDLASWLRVHDRKVPTILTSGSPLPATAAPNTATIARFFLKPYRAADVAACIRALQKERP